MKNNNTKFMPKLSNNKSNGLPRRRRVWIKRSMELPIITRPSTSHQSLILDHIGELVVTGQNLIIAYQVFNTSDNPLYVKFWDLNTTPTLGSDSPTKTIMVPAGGGANMSYLNGATFNLGIWWSATKNPAENDATDPDPNTLVANVDYIV